MRAFFCLLPAAAALWAQTVPITRLASVTFTVADLEKTRAFYRGMLGLEEAFDLKDANGVVGSAFFKINDDQYLEFSPGSVDDFRLERFTLSTPDLDKAAAELRKLGITPGPLSKSGDGAAYFAVKDPEQTEIRFARHAPGSRQDELRGKALGARRVSDHLQHVGLAVDHEAASMAFYRDVLGFREFVRGGPTAAEIRWIIMMAPGTFGDIAELMIMSSAPAKGRQHIAFEVPDIQRSYKQLVSQGLTQRVKPFPGQKANPRWILNLRDPNGLRVEFMGEPSATVN